jgi:hypothetical protein
VKPNLAVLVDGVPLPEEEARAIWVAFSAHMDEHPNDAAGFAASRGWVEASPEFVKGQAVLVVSTTNAPAAPARTPPPASAPARRRRRRR